MADVVPLRGGAAKNGKPTTSKKQKQRPAVLERMEAQKAELLAHRAAQDAKDEEFSKLLKAMEMESAKATHAIEDVKKSLVDESSAKTEHKIKVMKAERRRSIENTTSSLEMATRICRTFRNLELNAAARELEQFCVDCGCIHTIDVLNQ